ncbi:MAG: metallopeptidase family protein [Chloroflexi bacterium]|nr:metallopeptidase family protein [Chloroflexota bacterium]
MLVRKALRRLPRHIRDRLVNVAVVVEEEPSQAQRTEMGLGPEDTIFGLYSGIPLTERTAEYGLVVPDRIIIFRRPLQQWCRSEAELMEEVRRTVIHEVGHYFGLGEEALEEY